MFGKRTIRYIPQMDLIKGRQKKLLIRILCNAPAKCSAELSSEKLIIHGLFFNKTHLESPACILIHTFFPMHEKQCVTKKSTKTKSQNLVYLSKFMHQTGPVKV